MVDRNSQGRDTGEGFVEAVEEKTVRELLIELISHVKLLRLAMVRRGTAQDLGDLDALEGEMDPTWVEGNN